MKTNQVSRAAAQVLLSQKHLYLSDIDRVVNTQTYPHLKGSIGKVKEQLRIMIKKRGARGANRPVENKVNRNKLRENFLSRYICHMEAIYPLRTYSGRWAGGNNEFVAIHQSKGEPRIEVRSYTERSDNGKWSGLSGTFYIYINALKHKYDIIGGLLTVWDKNDTGREIPCYWFEQGRGMDVKTVEGFLIRGFHIKKTKSICTIEKAAKAASRIRSEAAREIWKKRQREQMMHLNQSQIKKLLAKTWITPDDSIAAGNCPAGTTAFQQRYQQKHGFGTVGAVRADELLNQANGSTGYINRIIRHKLGVNL